MKKNTVVTIALVSIPLIVGGFFIWKSLSKGGGSDKKKDVPPIDPKGKETPPAPNDFPLKKGVKNSYVGSLQTLLNTLGEKLVVDNAFGKLTEAALQKHFGITQVKDRDELENLKKKMANTSLLASNLEYGWKLVDAYKGGATNLVALQQFDLPEIKKNIFGEWKPTGKKITFFRNNRYNTDDYVIASAMSDGGLRIEVNKGDLAGVYFTPTNQNLKQLLDLE